MKHLLDLNCVILLAFTALTAWSPIASAACENGECIPSMIQNLDDLNSVYQKNCLPLNTNDAEIEKHINENGLSEECWKLITEINHQESQLLELQNMLEEKNNCQNGECQSSSALNGLDTQVSKIGSELGCSEDKKTKIKDQCLSDTSCVLAASAFGIGGYVSELILPKNSLPEGCSMGNDNCGAQLATGFLKAVFTLYDGLKFIKNKASEKLDEFWNWMWEVEDHSSTAQLTMANASEDEGVFDLLLKDFPGTMGKIWEAFVASIKQWLKNGVFCQKWSGKAQFSQCLEPTQSIHCLSCKTMITGTCSITGTLVAEIVPAFLTGGILTAAKHGANSAAKISKLFIVSDASIDLIKNSTIGKTIIENSVIHTGIRLVSKGISTSLTAIKAYLLSPTRKFVKTSFSFMATAAAKGGIFLAKIPGKSILVFSKNTLKLTAKVILYPIDNPLTGFAFREGSRSFDKILRLGKPQLANQTYITSSIIQRNGQLEELLVKIEEAKSKANPRSLQIKRLEADLLEEVSPYRSDITRASLTKENADLNDIITNLYPELQYGDLARSLPKEQVLKAEGDLFIELKKMPEGPNKQAMMDRYRSHTAKGERRSRVLQDANSPFDETVTPEKLTAQSNFNTILTPRQLEIKDSINVYSKLAHEELLEAATKIEKMIRSSDGPIIYDVVAIGAGPANGIAVSIIKETNPNLNVLVIEATENLGTFNKIKGFDINTPEFIGNSGNTFPGSAVQLDDFNFTNASFASAEDLGNLTIGTYKSANPDMLFNNKITKWEKEPSPGAWPAKYRVETESGVVVYAKSGLAGTGFGSPITRLKDPASIELVTKYENELALVDLAKNTNYVPRITSVDNFLLMASNDNKAGFGAVTRYQGKKVLVVGAGDGGNIATEATVGLNKQLNPTGANTNIETIWLGQEYSTGKELLESMSTRKKLRYSRIANEIDNGRIMPVNGYLSKVEEFTNELGVKQFKAFYTSKDGVPIGEPLIVDNIIFSTGYPNNHSTLTPIFSKQASDEIIFEGVTGRVDDFTRYNDFHTDTEITKRLQINGKPEDVYATGVFTKTSISDEEWKVPTGGFLDIFAPRSAATGKLIAQNLAPQNLTITQTHTLLKTNTDEMIKVIKRPKRSLVRQPSLPNNQVADIHTKIELGKSLRSFKSAPNTNFKVNITKGTHGDLVYAINGLDKKASEEVAKALSNNAQLTHGIDGQFNLGRTMLDVDVKTRASGTINLEELIFTPQTIAVTSPIFVPMNIGTGMNKFISPFIRSATIHERNKEGP